MKSWILLHKDIFGTLVGLLAAFLYVLIPTTISSKKKFMYALMIFMLSTILTILASNYIIQNMNTNDQKPGEQNNNDPKANKTLQEETQSSESNNNKPINNPPMPSSDKTDSNPKPIANVESKLILNPDIITGRISGKQLINVNGVNCHFKNAITKLEIINNKNEDVSSRVLLSVINETNASINNFNAMPSGKYLVIMQTNEEKVTGYLNIVNYESLTVSEKNAIGSICGYIFDELNFTRISHASVEIRVGQGSTTATTNSQGYFELTGLQLGNTYSLIISAPGYQTKKLDVYLTENFLIDIGGIPIRRV